MLRFLILSAVHGDTTSQSSASDLFRVPYICAFSLAFPLTLYDGMKSSGLGFSWLKLLGMI